MWQSLIAGVTSFFISYAFLPFIIRFSKERKIVAIPGRRRIHKNITPSLGGTAIFCGFTLALIFWSDRTHYHHTLLLLPILIIPFAIGLVDDLITLKPVAKLTAQTITATLVFFTLKVRLTSSYGLIGDHDFPLIISYLATLLTVIMITNSLNLIDGIDGLAAVLSLISILLFGTWFFFIEKYALAMVCFALSGGILAFLFQNWEPSKIFMGDTGSLVIGTLLSIITIQFINENHALETDNTFKFTSSVGTALAIIIIPLIDTTRVTLIRLSKRISPFKADKRHIHHVLVRLKLTHRQVVYVLALAHILFIGLAILLMKTTEGYLLSGILLTSIGLCLVLDRTVTIFFTRTETKPSVPVVTPKS